MTRTNLTLQGWHKMQHWRHCLTGMKHKEVDSLQCWQVQKCHFLFWSQTHSHSLQQQFKVEELLPQYQFISEWWMTLLDWRREQLWIVINHKCNTQHRMWPFKMAPCQGTPEVISGWKRVFLLAFTSIMIVGRSWMVWWCLQSNFLLAAHSRQAQVGGADAHQPTAQLTIFYAGMVHVYDDIPPSKVRDVSLFCVCALNFFFLLFWFSTNFDVWNWWLCWGC